jgi:hypothetical protein
MEKYLRVDSGLLGGSNLKFVIDTLIENEVDSMDALMDKLSVNDMQFRGEIFLPEVVEDESGVWTIDVPSLGYRFKEVKLFATGGLYYDRVVYAITGFTIERIYHLISYANSKSSYLYFWRDNHAGYTYNLEEAGVYTGDVIRKNLAHHHNGTKSTGVWSGSLYSEDYKSGVLVDTVFRPEVKAAIDHGVLEYSDLKTGVGKTVADT